MFSYKRQYWIDGFFTILGTNWDPDLGTKYNKKRIRIQRQHELKVGT